MIEPSAQRRDVLIAAMPAVFVLIWSTGFVVARYGMPYAPPLTFLTWRYVLSVLALCLWLAASGALWRRGTWPRSTQWGHLAVAGLLMHAGYLGGVWIAVRAGISAGMVALIVGLQPVLTALWLSARATRGAQRIELRQWTGLLLGLMGLLLVVWRKLGVGEVTPANLAFSLAALASITAGTLYQKRYVAPCDVRSANAVQLLAALAVTAPLALWFESAEPITLHPELIGAMAWSVLVLTLGGSSLLYLLIQRGAATQVASLMYLVPPCTALLAWWLFGEVLGPLVLGGFALSAFGVWLVAARRSAGPQ